MISSLIAGTVIGKISATDIDDPQTIHAKIKFSLLSGTEMFHIGPETGVLTTRTAHLDREVRLVSVIRMRHLINRLFLP